MVSTPGVTPCMMPGPVTAALALLLSQVPPGTPSVSVMPLPAHTLLSPEIVPPLGNDVTFTTSDVVAAPQLLVTEYEMESVPVVMPVTRPVVDTVALLLDAAHVPPATASERPRVVPRQTLSPPVMVPAEGNGFTVTTWVAATVPHALVML